VKWALPWWLVRSHQLGSKYRVRRGIALVGKYTVFAFDDELTEATIWEFGRDDTLPTNPTPGAGGNVAIMTARPIFCFLVNTIPSFRRGYTTRLL
jgi:hypothetical protein